MQPPCAAASSSSGLVLPSAAPMRVGSENSRPEKAPVPPEMEPTPRATFPSHTTSAVRSILGISSPRSGRRQRCRRGSRPPRASRRGGRRRAPAICVRAGVLEEWTSRAGRWTHVAGAQRPALAADVQLARAVEHVDDLVVLVEVVGRAADGDVADELGHGAAADLGRGEQPELAPRRRAAALPLDVDERVRRAVGGSGSRTRTERMSRPAASSTRHGVPRATKTPVPGGEVVALAADRRHAVPRQDVQHLVRVGVAPLGRRPREAQHALVELGAAALGAEERRRLDAVVRRRLGRGGGAVQPVLHRFVRPSLSIRG